MADLLKFNGTVYAPEPPAEMLDKAKSWNMQRCMVLGFDEGNNFVMGGSFSEIGDMLILLELAKRDIITGIEDQP